MNQNPPNSFYSSNTGTGSTGQFVEYFSTVDPTIYDVNFPVQKRWFNTTTNVEWILIGFSTSSGSLTANWQPISVGPDSDIIDHYALVGGPDHTITSVPPNTSGWVLTSNGNSVDPSFQPAALNDEAQYATFLVNPTPGLGTHETIQAAVTAAVSGNTIWIYEGTYTENVSITTPGLTISAYQGSVTIVGNLQYDAAGVLRLNDIFLRTGAGNALTVSGSSGSTVVMYGGGVQATAHTGILMTSTGGAIVCRNGSFNVSTTGIALFNASGADSTSVLAFINCYLENSGSSTTANVYNCQGIFERCFMSIPITSAGSGNSRYDWDYITTLAINSTSLTLGSAGNNGIHFCSIISGTGSCVVASAGTGEISGCFLSSSNALGVNAPFSLVAYGNTYDNSGVTINCVQAAGALGLLGVAPSAFAIGQLIQTNTSSGTPVNLTNNTPVNIAQISLTPGTWTIGATLGVGGSLTGTQTLIAISSISDTPGFNYGFDTLTSPVVATSTSDTTMVMTSYIVTVTTTTIYYLVASCQFTVGTAGAYGTITAQRTG